MHLKFKINLKKDLFIALGVISLIVFGIWFVHSDIANPKNEGIVLGTSFSPEYTRYLGLDVGEVYKVILDDWNFRYLRLTARWDNLETTRGEFDFTELDYLMNEAGKRNAKVVIAVGQKTPRWPECNVPEWATSLSDDEYFAALKNYLKIVAERYKTHRALETWQVENEAFLEFGTKCRTLDVDKLKAEVATIKSVDNNHLVMITDSGELSLWNKTAKTGDIFGSTAYRVVWNEKSGYFNYDWLPAFYYRAHAILFGLNLNKVYVSELQAEPWMPDHAITIYNVPEQLKSMNLERLEKQLDFAKRTGFSRAYYWGAEWWYWLKIHGYDGISEYIKNLPK